MEDEVEKTIEQEFNDDVHADLAAAMKELEGGERGEDGKFVAKEPEAVEPEPVAAEPAKEIPPAPQSLNAVEKAEWANLPDKAREIILRREQDFHKEFTSPDGALRLGREVKDIITPYMAQIQAEGATAPQAIQSLLNTAHILRTGTDEQKTALILNTAKQYGVKLNLADTEQEYVDPTIAHMQQQMEELRRLADPAHIRNTLTQEMESTRIQSDIAAFASDPAHVHFETVKPLMASIIQFGQAKDLKEAYDMACMANPTIRSTLEAAKAAELEAKRKQEFTAKKRAASSVTGSPAIPSNAKATNPKSSVEDDLRAVMDELETRV